MTRILVPPGIGDIYWVLVKLRGFLAAHQIENPEIWIDAPNDKKRSLEFVQRVPFVKAGGYHDTKEAGPTQGAMAGWRKRKGLLDPIRAEAYHTDGRHAFPGHEGFDWFMSYNGSMNAGRSLEHVDTQWPADWDLNLRVTEEEVAFGKALCSDIGPYIVAAFFDHGFYRKWLAELPAADIYDVLSRLHKATGCRIVLTGASWDDSLLNRRLMVFDEGKGRLLSMIGQTTLTQYFGAVRSAAGCIGFPAGNTMMSVVFGKPTAIIWNDFFAPAMHRNALPPHSPNYAISNTCKTPAAIAQDFLSVA